MPVDAVENAAVAREVEGYEREERREGRGVQFRIDEELVAAQGEAGPESLLLLEEGRLRVDKFGVEDAADIPFGLIYLLLRITIEREVEADIKELLLRLLQVVAQALQVLIRGIE